MKKFTLVLVALFVLSLTAAGASAGQLAKLTITPEMGDKLLFNFADGDISATVDLDSAYILFDTPGLSRNPNEEPIVKATPWKHHDIQGLDAPTLEFTSGEPYRLEMDLFFDGYEDKKDVREWTNKIEKLALVNQELHRPPTSLATPVCLVTWGDKTYVCEVEKTETKFTEFLGESTARAAATDERIPVRAVMHIVFSTLRVKGGTGIVCGNHNH